jgi:putative transposase
MAYLDWLGTYAIRYGVAIHAWVLMTNHVHLLMTPTSPAHASQLMQALGRRYVRHVNDAHERSGTLWEGRYRACAVHADDYLLACMQYIELNPVRAGLAADPADYRWSSYRRNAFGRPDPIISAHDLYTELGESAIDRQAAYRELFKAQPDEAAVSRIRTATVAGHLVATEGVRKEAEAQRGVPLGGRTRGRPKKTRTPELTVGLDRQTLIRL